MKGFLKTSITILLLALLFFSGCMLDLGNHIPLTVTYDGNSATTGTAPNDVTVYKEGQIVTVLGNTGNLLRTGYGFGGWNTAADGTGTNYAAGETFTMGTANVLLYARWTSISTNADLSALTVSEGTLSPAFSSATTGYTVEVLGTVSAIMITATQAEANASVLISPAQPSSLNMGANTITVTVSAQSGATKVYTVTVDRVGDYTSINIGTLQYVPAGGFQRDATASNINTMTTAFRMSQYEITRAQFAARFASSDPSNTTFSSGTSDPVQMTNWYHAIAFCNKLSLAEGLTPVYSVMGVDFAALTYAGIPTTSNVDWDAAAVTWTNNGYRLPTEMEWMWAAMGADTANPGAMNTTGYSRAFAGSTGSNDIGDFTVFGYYGSETGRTITESSNPVGSKTANELGLFDMSGNVWEWCWDWADLASWPSYTITGTVTSDSAAGRGAVSGTLRVLRGGSWGSDASYTTVACRYDNDPYDQNGYIGFRVVRP